MVETNAQLINDNDQDRDMGSPYATILLDQKGIVLVT